MRLTGGWVGSPPFLVKAVEDTILTKDLVLVEVNPATARELGIADGAAALLSTPTGSAIVKVNLWEGIMPGLIGMVRGLGHTAWDRFLAGKGVNVNRLMKPVEDPGTGFEAAWGVRAKLTKA
jgi:anaerobic selenocysteine-containing dehydrogenase